MEAQKIVNLLNNTENEYSKIAAKNGTLMTVNQRVTIHTKIQSNAVDTSDTALGAITQVAFKNCAPLKTAERKLTILLLTM